MRFVSAFVLLLAAACGPWDDDLAFKPQAVASVVAYDSSGVTQLALVQGTSTVLGWEQNLGVVTPLGGAIWNRRFWLLAPGAVHEIDLTSTASRQIRPVAPGIAALFAGDERLLALDTATREALLLRPGTTGFVQRPIALPFAPRSAVYLAGKWFVAGEQSGTDALYLAILDEGAETLRRTVFVTNGELVEVQTDGLFVYLVLQGAGVLDSWRVDPAAELVSFLQTFAAQAVAYSPFNRVFYGDEYTSRLTLAGGVVSPVNVQAASFTPDFQGGRLYYVADGQLRRVRLSQPHAVESIDTLSAFSGQLRASWHLYLPQD